MSITPERAKFHELLKQFKEWVNKTNLVYDIGKSSSHNYKPLFRCTYRTIDKDPDKKPDIVCDVEGDFNLPLADGIICMGVTEQCDNPYKLIEGVNSLIKPNGVALFGVVSVGYPIYDKDYVRFTPCGVKRLLNKYNILEEQTVFRYNLPSYIFVIGSKKHE